MGTRLLYFHDSHLQQNDANPGNGFMQQETYLFFLNLCEFKGFGAKRLAKEFATKVRRTPL